MPADFEQALIDQVRGAGLPAPVPQLRFMPRRMWRLDLAWPERLLAVEVQGAVWSQGKHARGSGIVKDCEKYCWAAILGWRLLPIPTNWIVDGKGEIDGRALSLLQRALQD